MIGHQASDRPTVLCSTSILKNNSFAGFASSSESRRRQRHRTGVSLREPAFQERAPDRATAVPRPRAKVTARGPTAPWTTRSPYPLRHVREAPESQRWRTVYEAPTDHVGARLRAEYRGVDLEVVNARQVDGLLPQAHRLRY